MSQSKQRVAKSTPRKQSPAATAAMAVTTSQGRPKQVSRVGRVQIGAHVAQEVQIQLKIIAARELTTIEGLLKEAMDMLFADRGEPQIATQPPASSASKQ